MSLLLLLGAPEDTVAISTPAAHRHRAATQPNLIVGDTDVAPPAAHRHRTAGVPTISLVRSWTVTALVGSDDRGATGVNDAGEICGGSADGHAATWEASDPAVITLLEFLGSDDFAIATAINASGVVCGFGYEVGDTSCGGVQAFHAYKWTGGVALELPPVGGDCSALAQGLNDDGQVVGYSFPAGGGVFRAVIWNGTTPTVLDDLPTSTDSRPTAVNAFTQVVGGSAPAGDDAHATVWDDGTTAVDISGPDGAGFFAYAVNDDGLGAGALLLTGFAIAGAAWSDVSDGDSISRLPAAGGIDLDDELTFAFGISDDGVIAGTAGAGLGTQVPVVWEDAAADPLKLPLLAPAPTAYAGDAFAVSPNGELVVGWSYDVDEVAQAALWTRHVLAPAAHRHRTATTPTIDTEGIVWMSASGTVPTQLPKLIWEDRWVGHEIRVRLYGAGMSFDQDTLVYADELADELPTAGGYVAGGVELTTKSVEVIDADNRIRLLSDPVEITVVGSLTAAFAVAIDVESGVDATSPVISVLDFDGLKTADDGQIYEVAPGEDGWLFNLVSVPA